MSRVGKNPVAVPAGVTVQLAGSTLTVKGKLGTLTLPVSDDVVATVEDGTISVQPRTESRRARMLWGTTRANIANMVRGVSEGFTRNLDIEGVGFRAAVEGRELVLSLGFSHPVRYSIPDGVTVKCEKPTSVTVSGFDRQRVGQVAAEIRGFKKPEPYKGKGIRYADEVILRKEGKKK
ncbi:MAG TPA: 50S ribosomal protein L6 [Azospirillaceae bacterium]|nr:50S ribosomal protein L6 [Azospirillaceae bacterium]